MIRRCAFFVVAGVCVCVCVCPRFPDSNNDINFFFSFCPSLSLSLMFAPISCVCFEYFSIPSLGYFP